MQETRVGKIPWRRERLPTPVFWPGESYGLYRPWGRKELDMTELLLLSLFFLCMYIFIQLSLYTKYCLMHFCLHMLSFLIKLFLNTNFKSYTFCWTQIGFSSSHLLNIFFVINSLGCISLFDHFVLIPRSRYFYDDWFTFPNCFQKILHQVYL